MRFLTALLATGVLVSSAMATPPAPTDPVANVWVRFTAPETFTDATYDNRRSSLEQVTRDLAAQFAALGQRYLPPGQRLVVDVLDVDLAGRYEPWHQDFSDVRYMRDITWPRIHFTYQVVDQDGSIVASGDEDLGDMQYLMRPAQRRDGDRLRYEKAMLDTWFRARFARAPA